MKKTIVKKAVSGFHIKFQFSLLMLIFLMLGISTFSTLTAVLSVSRNVSKQKAEQLFNETGYSIKTKLDTQFEKAIQLTGLMTTLPVFTEPISDDGTRYAGLPFLIEALRLNSFFYSVYTGFSNGDFIQLIQTSSNPLILDALHAPDNTSYILRTISSTESERKEYWTFFDSGITVISSDINLSPTYQPSERPWFSTAVIAKNGVILTAPYIYNSLKKPGITAAAAQSADIVTGIDITLENLETFIDGLYISPGAGVLVLDKEDRILAANPRIKSLLSSSDPALNPIGDIDSDILAFLTGTIGNGADKKAVNKLHADYLLWKKPWKTPGGQDYQLIIFAPASDFLQHQQIIQHRIILISTLVFILVLPLIILVSIYFSRFLKNLADDAERIQHMIFDKKFTGHSPIIEFEKLSVAFAVMKEAIAAKTLALETALQKLERIIEMGIAMSVEHNSDKLVEMILKGAKELAGADGGSLYLKEKSNELGFKIILNDSLGFEQGGASSNPISLPPVQLYLSDGEPNFHNVVSSAFHKAETIVIDDAYMDPHYDFSGTREFDKLNNYRSKSFLTVPLKLQGSDIIGALQLINCHSKDVSDAVPFSKDIQSLIEALSSLAAAILNNRILLDSQDALFESLIQLTANAIDTKSPYTGGHCERVPVLARLLAEQAENAKEGPLADFSFNTPIEKKAFIIGAWLHDAGKMTTPEFIVDKAVKLETIHNRIHEIRTRFEVLLRDVRIKEKEALLAGRDPEEAAAELEAAERKLYEDFDFIARANTGEEFVNEEYINRLKEISKRTWLSHFNHTIGLSRDEQKKQMPPYIPGKPIEEQLLADKPQHIVPDSGKTRKIYSDYGFVIPHPDYLYNRGEIHNLLIRYGTLTEEERYKINEHIMQTIVMLDKLPFPIGMNLIPEFVGTHHETLSGTGYPRGLKSDQLSVPSRIMAIADIFEALTASDRPYKDAKKLSEAVEILYQETLTNHIDGDLFELFLTSGIYLEYSKEFMSPDQIDQVDIKKYIRQL